MSDRSDAVSGQYSSLQASICIQARRRVLPRTPMSRSSARLSAVQAIRGHGGLDWTAARRQFCLIIAIPASNFAREYTAPGSFWAQTPGGTSYYTGRPLMRR